MMLLNVYLLSVHRAVLFSDGDGGRRRKYADK